MRFLFGTPVVEQTPIGEGWRELLPFGAMKLQIYGLVVFCLGMLLVSVFLDRAISPSSTWKAILILIMTMPIHELIHALTTPAWGFSEHTILGIQKGRNLMLPYMLYEGIQPLWRMLLTGISPLILLTVLPVVIILFAPLPSVIRAGLSFLAFFNVAISGGDLVNFYWIISRLPARAIVKGNGWALLWKGENFEDR